MTYKAREQDYSDCGLCFARIKSVFNELNTEEVTLLNRVKKCVNFKKGDIIFQEGTYPHGLYCVNKGKIKLYQLGAEGKEQIMHFAKESDILGYRAILGKDKYSCSAVALDDCNLCFIPIDTFNNLVENNPKMAFQIISLFSSLLKQAERKITSLAQTSVKERIAQSLLLLKECYGYESDGATINVVITREEIANISGTTRETATRLLFELKDEQLINLDGKKVRILKPRELLNVANLQY
jgi:CRP/FNR family transcriptional regulator